MQTIAQNGRQCPDDMFKCIFLKEKGSPNSVNGLTPVWFHAINWTNVNLDRLRHMVPPGYNGLIQNLKVIGLQRMNIKQTKQMDLIDCNKAISI